MERMRRNGSIGALGGLYDPDGDGRKSDEGTSGADQVDGAFPVARAPDGEEPIACTRAMAASLSSVAS